MCQTLREAKRMAHFSPIQQTVRGKATHPTPSPTRHDYFQAASVSRKGSLKTSSHPAIKPTKTADTPHYLFALRMNSPAAPRMRQTPRCRRAARRCPPKCARSPRRGCGSGTG